MFGKTLTLLLIAEIQDTLAIKVGKAGEGTKAVESPEQIFWENDTWANRNPRITTRELNQLVDEELAAGNYDIDNGLDNCTLYSLKRTLKRFFRGEYRCNYKNDLNARHFNPIRLDRCMERYETMRDEALEGCLITTPDQGESTPGESETNPDQGESTPDQGDTTPDQDETTPIEGDGSGETIEQCLGNMEIPSSCSDHYQCATIKQIYEYTQTRVEVHNNRRRRHVNTPDVGVNLDIACQAQQWADYMAENNHWGHAPWSRRQSPPQGENLAMMWTSGEIGSYTPELGWYDNEIIHYDFDTGTYLDDAPRGAQIGHFTQMVWDDTTAIGCGESRISRNGMQYLYSVCRYNPPGNFTGRFAEHVQRLRD